MSIDQMREAIKKAYPAGGTWQLKVAKMSDAQVLAIYTRFKEIKKIK